jgi:hypothetical protein
MQAPRPPPKVPDPPMESGLGGRTLADIWDSDKVKESTERQLQEQAGGRMHAASARADADLLAEMARERAGSRSAPGGEGSGRERCESAASSMCESLMFFFIGDVGDIDTCLFFSSALFSACVLQRSQGQPCQA